MQRRVNLATAERQEEGRDRGFLIGGNVTLYTREKKDAARRRSDEDKKV